MPSAKLVLHLQALAQVVANQLGGRCSYAELSQRYTSVAGALKQKRGSIALPIGALSVGLARHRSLLFKSLADASELPCRLLRGRFYLGECVSILHSRSLGRVGLTSQCFKLTDLHASTDDAANGVAEVSAQATTHARACPTAVDHAADWSS